MNTEPNPSRQLDGELPSQFGQAQQSPDTSSPPVGVTRQVGLHGQKQLRCLPVSLIVRLIVLAVLLISGGDELISSITVYQPDPKHTQATATAVLLSLI